MAHCEFKVDLKSMRMNLLLFTSASRFERHVLDLQCAHIPHGKVFTQRCSFTLETSESLSFIHQ